MGRLGEITLLPVFLPRMQLTALLEEHGLDYSALCEEFLVAGLGHMLLPCYLRLLVNDLEELLQISYGEYDPFIIAEELALLFNEISRKIPKTAQDLEIRLPNVAIFYTQPAGSYL